MGGRGLVNLLNWQEKQFTNKNRRVLQFASLNFDVSFQEIFSTLCYGSRLYLINGDRRRDMAELVNDIRTQRLTHLFMPYIVLKNLVEHVYTLSNTSFSVEEIIVAGEQLKLSEDILNLLKKTGIRLVNQYGPTEAHVVSSYNVDNNSSISLLPPIGKPIDNMQLYILGRRYASCSDRRARRTLYWWCTGGAGIFESTAANQ
jgi:non-ribosomal peptide synthetase component F